MTDRELLEKAARAAGIAPREGEEMEIGEDKIVIYGNGHCTSWRPITDDGDALRLAVRLDLLIMPYPLDKAIRVTRLDLPEFIERYTDDQLAATRRAIVRAAAAIGEQE